MLYTIYCYTDPMRLNRFIASNTDLSRRKADDLIAAGKVVINRQVANLGTVVSAHDTILIDGKKINLKTTEHRIVLLHKPVGYVCSRDGQGSPTVYDLLQKSMQQLNIAGRLDKDSSGLVVLTDDGILMQELTHPSNDKEKVYIITLSKPLADGEIARIAKGVDIGDKKVSKLLVLPLKSNVLNLKSPLYEVRIYEGRNRQIRRSFEALGYHVVSLHRTQLGPYKLGSLVPKQYKEEK
jgi:23S rRNA pseudouridine2605 synthase